MSDEALERRRARKRAWNKAHPEKVRAAVSRWQKNAPKSERYMQGKRDNSRRWAKANPEKRREADRRRRERNPERKINHEHRRRARRKATSGRGWTAADVAAQYKAQRGRCFYCAARLGKKFHRDHITPLARGGAHCRSNLALACPGCNMRKHSQCPQEFAGILL